MKRLLPLLLAALAQAPAQAQAPKWPDITQQHKPWTRWWWQGSAVNRQDLSRLLTEYQQAGLGGVEITTIYGVKGAEKEFINFLSPQWLDMLTHTFTEAGRLGLGVDMAQASGWPFGGPWVKPEDACKYLAYRTYAVKGGEVLTEPVGYTQKPMMRAVGLPMDVKTMQQPVARNPDLQLHAFDQVRFEVPLPLQTLMAYSDQGQTLDLTGKVGPDGKLSWTAPAGAGWTLYAIFQGWHGKQVERAGPGGEGDVIDHFSRGATDNYLRYFDEAFKGRDIKPLRAFFNDSYEVDDAQGEGNWTPQLFQEFQRRRGYDLRQHLPALLGKAADDENQRVLSDYRETISELLLENYTRTWHAWAQKHDALIRNQAHGSPANILDLYAATDIPETEGEDLLRLKFASSAAHVTGKPLTSAETATWENDHFLSSLGDVKKAVDRMLLGGVNHVFYHGTNYSPQRAAWPGWLFYAAVHFNPNNSFWPDFGQLNRYAARCQSFLQAGQPAHDVLLYLPIYDSYAQRAKLPATAEPDRAKLLLQHYDGITHGFKGLPVGETGETLLKRGYGFDFISDLQLLGVKNAGRGLQTSAGTSYQTVLVPAARLMPLPTLQQLLKLAKGGATVVFQGQLPQDVPGLGALDTRRAAFKKLIGQLKLSAGPGGGQQAAVGKGRVLVGADVDGLLTAAGVQRETLVDQGLEFVRRRHAKGHYYFVTNWGDKPLMGWVPLRTAAKSVAQYNPMTEKLGLAATRPGAAGQPEVYLQLAPGEACILETNEAAISGPAYAYQRPAGAPQPLQGSWSVQFLTGGPELPAKVDTRELASWTTFGEAARKFSGTARYTTTFAAPGGAADGWLLDLGRVGESARVQLNGQDLGTLIGPSYQVFIPREQLKASNTLTVQVSNGMANRIIDMDKRGVEWKRFYNVNVAAKLKENRDEKGLFTAAKWEPRPSGLLGPVTLTPTSTRVEKVQ
ncbi:glycoside hydrolase family 2 protein [Hymenobacter gummosus]|uniref:Glycoside hydrolase family 2 protein n=1 Tax=Hymenobacter gummosus TaxID=1776032 RepID=A0A431TZT1_9BACT|nr:glycosyl hydrolase [Hymenobacter gummosus]RTQ48127.1 glycoside hydrolase family 2 protein [Hymenobacter gummosus]